MNDLNSLHVQLLQEKVGVLKTMIESEKRLEELKHHIEVIESLMETGSYVTKTEKIC